LRVRLTARGGGGLSEVERKYQPGNESAFLRLFRNGKASGRRWMNVPLLSRLGVAIGVLAATTWRERWAIAVWVVTLRFRAVMNLLRRKLDDGGLPMVNRFMVARCQPQVRQILEVIADEKSHPVAIFCTAGKDRTGFIVAMLLAALGTEQSKIVADYTKSEEMYRKDPEQKMKQVKLLEKAGLTPDRWIGNPPAVIEAVFEAMRRRHGSVAEFLRSAGVSQDTQARLRKTLLINP